MLDDVNGSTKSKHHLSDIKIWVCFIFCFHYSIILNALKGTFSDAGAYEINYFMLYILLLVSTLGQLKDSG